MDMDGQIAQSRVGRRRWRRREGGVRLRSRCRSSSFLMPLLRLRVKLCALCFRLRSCLRAAGRGLHVASVGSRRHTVRVAGVCSRRPELVDAGPCSRPNSFHAEAMIKECLEFIKRCSSAVAVEQAPAMTV